MTNQPPMAPNRSKRSNDVLAYIYARGGARVRDVASHIGTAQNTASTCLRRLEKAGYLRRPYAGMYLPTNEQE